MWSNALFIMGFFGSLAMGIVAGALIVLALLLRPEGD